VKNKGINIPLFFSFSLRQLQLYTNTKIINVSRGEQGQPWLLFNIPTRGFLWEAFIIFLQQPAAATAFNY
jgi:hypothetical protein